MKKHLTILLTLLFISQSQGGTEGHVPWCNYSDGHYQANSTDCYGFAQAMAYGRGITHSKCPAASGPILGGMSGYYFEEIFHNSNGLSLLDLDTYLAEGDVLEFSNHAVYVYDIVQPLEGKEDVLIWSKASESTQHWPEQTNLAAWEAANSQNPAKKIWRRSNDWYIKVYNNFGDGEIGVKDKYGNWINFQHGSSTMNTTATFKWESNVHIDAVEEGERWSGDKRFFLRWQTNVEGFTNLYNKQDDFIISNEKPYIDTPEITCHYWRQLEFTFCYNFIGISVLGKMEIDEEIENNISSSQIFTEEEDKSFPFTAIDQYYNGIIYNFSSWNDGSNTKYRTTPDDHSYDFVANFTGKPLQVQNIRETGQINMPIHLVWDEHINPNVSYKIYRKTRDQYGHETGPNLIASLPHGTTSYTDYDFIKRSSYEILIRYDVRAYYSVENTSADTHWFAVFGIYFIKDISDSLKIGNDLAIETFNIFPNPANPTTSININLKKSGNVNLRIFDVNGKIIKKIFEGQIAPGNHRYIWNGDNDSGYLVSSGIYFIIIETPTRLFKRKIILLR